MPTPNPTPTARPTPARNAQVCDISVTISETAQLQQYEPFRVEITRTVKDVPVATADETTNALIVALTLMAAQTVAARTNPDDVPF